MEAEEERRLVVRTTSISESRGPSVRKISRLECEASSSEERTGNGSPKEFPGLRCGSGVAVNFLCGLFGNRYKGCPSVHKLLW